MTVVLARQKRLSLKIDAPLYSLLEQQAGESGEVLNDLVQRLLKEAMNEWCDYCDTIRQLSEEEERSLHVCVK